MGFKNQGNSYNTYDDKVGLYIWKYYGKSSKTKNIFKTKGGRLAIIAIVEAIIICGVTVWIIFLNRNGELNKISKWIITIGMIADSAILVLLSNDSGRKNKAEKLVFARDVNNRLFVFDYNSEVFKRYIRSRYVSEYIDDFSISEEVKMIKYIDEKQIIEEIINDGHGYDLGKGITKVISIEEKKSYSNIHCMTKEYNKYEKMETLIIPKKYKNYSGLINAFKSLIEIRSYDQEELDKEKKKIKIIKYISIIVAGISLVTCVYLRYYIESHEPKDVPLVTATVIKSETVYYFRFAKYTVVVNYDGREYNLKNVHETWGYIPWETTEAYYYNGELYANMEGVMSSSTYGIVYFLFLAIGIASVIVYFIFFNGVIKYKIQQFNKKIPF